MRRITDREGFQANEARLRAVLLAGLDGDAAAYREFLQALSRHLRGFLRRRLARLPDDVEDLVQECLLAVHNRRHTYDAAQPLTAWVYAIARYKLIDFLRRRGSVPDLMPLGDQAELMSTSDADAAEARRDVAKLLEQLPERQRVPIVCVKVQGLSVREAAQRTGMSESAVKVGIHRGLRALAAKMSGSR